MPSEPGHEQTDETIVEFPAGEDGCAGQSGRPQFVVVSREFNLLSVMPRANLDIFPPDLDCEKLAKP